MHLAHYVLALNIFVFVVDVAVTQQQQRRPQDDSVCRIIRRNGYTCEIHRVQTADGYQLTLHRIPQNVSCAAQLPHRKPQPFVLMHGLIGSAGDFVAAGRRRALAFLLHRRCFDVWLPNARGTTFSRAHRRLNTNNAAFWNFSWHEIGIYDLAAIVDYVLAQTRHARLHYVAHSQGSTVLLVLLAERPAYNERFASAALLAPIAFLEHLSSAPLRLLARDSRAVTLLLNQLGLHELLPASALSQVGGRLLCSSALPTYTLCSLLTSFYVGFSDFPLDRNIFLRILETTPAGISRKQLQHFGQLINSGKFRQFDYKSESVNLRYYGRITPPDYNLRNVRVPLQLFYGGRDALATSADVQRLARELTQTSVTLFQLRGYNHIDMLYSNSAARLVYERIINKVVASQTT